MIFCLDLGTKTGWVLGDKENFYSGVENFTPKRYEGGGMRYLRFRRWVFEIIQLSESIGANVNEIYYEEVRRHAGTDAAHVYGGFLSHLAAFGDEYEIPYAGVPVGTIKKHITGKGNANKKLVLEAVRALGYNPKDDNESDAIALYEWAYLNSSPN